MAFYTYFNKSAIQLIKDYLAYGFPLTEEDVNNERQVNHKSKQILVVA